MTGCTGIILAGSAGVGMIGCAGMVLIGSAGVVMLTGSAGMMTGCAGTMTGCAGMTTPGGAGMVVPVGGAGITLAGGEGVAPASCAVLGRAKAVLAPGSGRPPFLPTIFSNTSYEHYLNINVCSFYFVSTPNVLGL